MVLKHIVTIYQLDAIYIFSLAQNKSEDNEYQEKFIKKGNVTSVRRGKYGTQKPNVH